MLPRARKLGIPADAVQQAAVYCLERLGTLESITPSYFLQLAENRGRNQRRAAWRATKRTPAVGSVVDLERAERPERPGPPPCEARLALDAALAALAEQPRALLSLLYGLNGKPRVPLAEAGASLGLEYGAALRMKDKALAQLRKQLGAQGLTLADLLG